MPVKPTPSQNPVQNVRQYRPNPTGNREQDIANRQTFDFINSVRNGYTPAMLYSKGTAQSVTVPSKAASQAPSGFGVSVTFNRAGTWVLSASVALKIIGDHGSIFTVSMTQADITQPHFATWSQGADGMVQVHQTWQLTSTTGTDVCTLYIQKDTGAGTSIVIPVNSTLSATWQGPI